VAEPTATLARIANPSCQADPFAPFADLRPLRPSRLRARWQSRLPPWPESPTPRVRLTPSPHRDGTYKPIRLASLALITLILTIAALATSAKTQNKPNLIVYCGPTCIYLHGDCFSCCSSAYVTDQQICNTTFNSCTYACSQAESECKAACAPGDDSCVTACTVEYNDCKSLCSNDKQGCLSDALDAYQSCSYCCETGMKGQ
jgi:hypothetical protein